MIWIARLNLLLDRLLCASFSKSPNCFWKVGCIIPMQMKHIFRIRVHGEQVFVSFQVMKFWAGCGWLSIVRHQDIMVAIVVEILGFFFLVVDGLLTSKRWRSTEFIVQERLVRRRWANMTNVVDIIAARKNARSETCSVSLTIKWEKIHIYRSTES